MSRILMTPKCVSVIYFTLKRAALPRVYIQLLPML